MPAVKRRACLLLLLALLLASCVESPPNPPSATAAPPDENAAIAALREINDAQTNYIRRTRRYAQTYAELIAEKLMNERPSVDKTGYEILLRPSPDAVSYTVIATPSKASPAARYLFTDQTGAIRADATKPATAESPAL
jgi:hypothetical protein